jgi:hypothetical protein
VTISRAGSHTVAHQVNRLVVDADAGLDDLRRRYESLVPEIDADALSALIEKGDLDQVRLYTAEGTPHTFARSRTFDPTPMMQLAGHHLQVMTYMIGNNVIVETMFRHDPAVMLYTGRRTAIYRHRGHRRRALARASTPVGAGHRAARAGSRAASHRVRARVGWFPLHTKPFRTDATRGSRLVGRAPRDQRFVGAQPGPASHSVGQ